MSRPVRVLLLWPGSVGASAGNFGMPQLVLLASYAQAKTGAQVEVRDLALEAGLGWGDYFDVLAGEDGRGYDIIGFSVYSSFDHLKCVALAEMARERWPDAVLVAGGYHPSARPLEYANEASPIDVCVVGEGERPLVEVIDSVEGGEPMRCRILGPAPIADLASLPATDWSLLSRYRAVARNVASQAQVYLSRGCPFDCAFCMESAKRETSWRPLPVDRAVAEIRSLHEFLDLRGWTLFVADALFGMKRSWRREFLAALAREDIPVEKYWLLTRIDLAEDEDLRLYSDANCGLGFGLESGDPRLLGAIRKSGHSTAYLDRMLEIAASAEALDLPWGANIICGHPGETEDTMRVSARYLERLFVERDRNTGFLSVDPFRLYPGSPIDARRRDYEREYGTRFHRLNWWHDGDPEFLSEWVDPSRDLDYLRREALQHELLTPILSGIEDRFVYAGKARDYFVRAMREQLDLTTSRARMADFERYYAWQSYLGGGRRKAGRGRLAAHEELRKVATDLRRASLLDIADLSGLDVSDPVLSAIARVPRERFVPLDAIDDATRDVAVALDDSRLATVSAMHAYACTFALLGLGEGDDLLDLGAGTGYGTALASDVVGAMGAVVGLELDPALVARGRQALASVDVNPAILSCGDALDPETWPARASQLSKVAVGFALDSLPTSWLHALAPGTVVVAPLWCDGSLRLCRVVHCGTRFDVERHDEVSYVRARTRAEVEGTASAPLT